MLRLQSAMKPMRVMEMGNAMQERLPKEAPAVRDRRCVAARIPAMALGRVSPTIAPRERRAATERTVLVLQPIHVMVLGFAEKITLLMGRPVKREAFV